MLHVTLHVMLHVMFHTMLHVMLHAMLHEMLHVMLHTMLHMMLHAMLHVMFWLILLKCTINNRKLFQPLSVDYNDCLLLANMLIKFYWDQSLLVSFFDVLLRFQIKKTTEVSQELG